MPENKTPKTRVSEFIVCVLKPDPNNTLHIIVHPVLLVSNDGSEPYVSPESVINRFKIFSGFQNHKMISISKNKVDKKYWNMLKEGVKDAETRDEGIEIETEILYS